MSAASSVLTVMAHADDAELWAGGTLAVHAQAGAPVTIAVPRANEVRDQEAAVGAEALGALLRPLDELTVSTIRDLLTDLRPDVVITHNPDDIHPRHQSTARTVLAALPEVVIATGHPRRVYTCDGYNNLDPMATHCTCRSSWTSPAPGRARCKRWPRTPHNPSPATSR